MWPDEGQGGAGAGPARSSTGSEVVITNGRVQAAVNSTLPAPPVSGTMIVKSMTIANSPRPHLGPKYEYNTVVNQSDQVVKGGCLNLELISPVNARRLRCSVAVFVCWMLVVASGLIIYFFHFALTIKTRLDIDLPCTAFVWAYIKNSTRAERLCCTVATVILALSISLAVYFTVFYNKESDTPRDSEGWFISRDEWLADPYDNTDIEPAFEPIPLVSIQHSVSNECNRFKVCAAELRNLQGYFITKYYRDIPYNFLIGNDGRVYEGRGWRKEGAHTKYYNKCTVGIGFIGDYREEKGTYTKVTQLQRNNMYKLLEEGVEKGFLLPDYQIVAALDITNTTSPGSNLYKAMQQWPHYDYQHRYRNKTCQEIIHSTMAHSHTKR